MTRQQIKWAAQHDWFIRQSGNGVVVRGDCGEPDEVFFNDAKALRAWAGY